MSSQISSNNEQRNLPASSADAEFYSVLLRVIESTKTDSAQLRSLIYKLARIKLKREAWSKYPALSSSEVREHLLALESAIDRVEATSAQEDEFAAVRPPEPSALAVRPRPREEVLVVDPRPLGAREYDAVPVFSEPVQRHARVRPSGRFWSFARPTLQLVGAAALGTAIFMVVAERYDLYHVRTTASLNDAARSRETHIKDGPRTEIKVPSADPMSVIRAQYPDMPLPTAFGVYAVSQGQLKQLELLPTRAPDARVLIGPVFAKPSETRLPDGAVAFIVFRRDLVTSAPDKVPIRVVARIARAMTFNSGKPATTNLDDAWTVRSKAYEFKVSPLGDSQEMILIRPDAEGFSLPAGRYALVLKGQAYDFSVDGAIKDSSQCLERIETVNGLVYSECRDP